MLVHSRIHLTFCTIMYGVSACLFAGPLQAGTITWNGAAGTDSWHTPGNWDLNRVPASSDDVSIPNVGASADVTFNSGATIIRTLSGSKALVLAGGTLTINVNSSYSGPCTFSASNLYVVGLTLSSTLNWTGGQLNRLSGAQSGGITIDVSGSVTISGGFLSCTLDNDSATSTIIGTGRCEHRHWCSERECHK